MRADFSAELELAAGIMRHFYRDDSGAGQPLA